ncbi:MAG: helix-turn-helix domain-containing protein [Patescibacteria group bacterium]
MRVLRTQKVLLKDLKLNLFVRKKLDDDQVWFLAELIENGVKMNDRIMVTKNLTIVDGRQRFEAYGLNNVTEVEVDIVDIQDEVDIIFEAYRANTGGSKPPTSEDTEHTIELLLERKQTIKAIAERLGLPPSTTRKFVSDVKSRLDRRKLMEAVDAITNGGLTITQAAEKYDVDIAKLKEFLSVKKKGKMSHGIDNIQRDITFTYKSVGSKNGSALKKLLEKFEDGDVTAKQVAEVIKHIEDCQKKSSRAVADWKVRFKAKYNEQNEEAVA